MLYLGIFYLLCDRTTCLACASIRLKVKPMIIPGKVRLSFVAITATATRFAKLTFEVYTISVAEPVGF